MSMIYSNIEPSQIQPFRFWCQKILPAVYDDSLSYYELLCKVIDKLNEVIEQINIHSDVILQIQKELAEFQALLNQFMEHGFDDYYREQVERWIDEHLRYIFEQVVSTVFFGLTDDGYFCAWIPASWHSIFFDTIMDYSNEQYGHLVLKY